MNLQFFSENTNFYGISSGRQTHKYCESTLTSSLEEQFEISLVGYEFQWEPLIFKLTSNLEHIWFHSRILTPFASCFGGLLLWKVGNITGLVLVRKLYNFERIKWILVVEI